jgi:hypothetical protein
MDLGKADNRVACAVISEIIKIFAEKGNNLPH